MATSTTEYTASVPIVIGLGSLASSANGDVGQEATAIDNSVNKFIDVFLSGRITTHASILVTINTQIQLWLVANRTETPTWPDVITGTDSATTWTSVGTRNSAAVLFHVLDVDTTTVNKPYDFSGLSVASAFGGVMPRNWTVFVTQNTGQILHATAGNHVLEYQGIKYASA